MNRRILTLLLLATISPSTGCGPIDTTMKKLIGSVASSKPEPISPLEVRQALRAAGIGPVATVAPESSSVVALGEALFFDKILSGPRDVACATCHHPTAGTGDGLPLSLGTGAVGVGAARTATDPSQLGPRNAPGLFHVAAANVKVMFRDTRVSRDPLTGALTTPEPTLNGRSPARPDLAGPLTSALAAQAMFPVTNRGEMLGQPGVDPQNELALAPDNVTTWALIMARLVGTQEGTVGGIEEYRAMFRAAFPDVLTLDELTFGHAARAIAAYEASTFAFFDAPVDRFMAGNDALTETEMRGALLFTGAGRCAACHSGPLLSDGLVHAIAAPQLGPGAGGEPDDRGRGLITLDFRDDYRFVTPSLRNVDQTAPFTHAGAYATLADVIEHHRDPVNALLFYDPARHLPLAFQGLYVRDPTLDQARLTALSPRLTQGLTLTPQEVGDLVAFVQALTDPRARIPVPAPASVPSGLPVD